MKCTVAVIITLILTLFSIGCVNSTTEEIINQDNKEEPTICNINSQEPCHNRITFTVFIDQGFPMDKRLLLFDAFETWSIKTNRRVEFDVTFVEPQNLLHNAYVKHTFYVFNENPHEPQYTGYATWTAEGAFIQIRTDLALSAFEPIALHEIGHALHLIHYEGDEPSIMHPFLQRGRNISCLDLKNFCREWQCELTC